MPELPEVESVVRIDEAAGVVYYTAHDGDNHLKLQFHRVGLDGKNNVSLTPDNASEPAW